MLETLGQYRVLDRIGAGGMGEVYRARDTRLGRTVAIKVLPDAVADDPDRRARFVREAQAAAALSHPNIAALYEIGEDRGRLFLVFEFVPGEPLRTVIGGRPLNPRRAVQCATQIADALADAHAAGIVHRDIKPDNIIITPKGNAKILDFGLATWTAGGAARELAVTTVETGGVALGTVAYMSPEQARGEPLDHRTDIFSLGVVLHEMLTGTAPFRGTTATAVALQIVQALAPPPSSANPAVPRELDAVVAKALEKQPDQRYGSAAALAGDLRAVDAALGERVESSARVEAIGITRPRPARGRWIAAATMAAVAVAIVAFARAPIGRLLRRTVASPPSPVVAVLPLELPDAAASERYFADGLTEDLITRLGQTPGVRVIGRSATRAYRGRAPRDLARELGAGVVLAGSVRPGGDSVKVSLELIDPNDSTAIWTGQYTREMKDIFAVQAQVAEDVARALRVKLQPTAASTRTASRLVDQRAYDAYLRGRDAASQRNIDQAKRQFEHAVELDDGLAEAHAGLAEALHLEAVFFGAPDDPDRRAKLKKAADRAAELDPDLPQAKLALALASDRLPDALAYLKSAIAIDPAYSEGYHQLGDQIQDFDPERAIAFYRRALAIDPRMDINHADIVAALSALGRHAEARRELEESPDAAGWKRPLRLTVALDEGRYEEALASMRSSGVMADIPVFRLGYIYTLQMAGHRDEAHREAEKLVRDSPTCEARAALAGIKQELGQAAAARQLAAPALQAATRADVGPNALRCAALSAAAIADVGTAAKMIRRIAADEKLLRFWALEIMGTTSGKLLRRSMFPWTHVASAPDVVDAKRALEAAYARVRLQIADILSDVRP
jgi:TolB-like protein